MVDLKFLRVHCHILFNLERIFESIHVPQFKNLDTVRLSISSRFRAVATDDSGHTFEFLQLIGGNSNFCPLQHLGAEVTTLRLGQRKTLQGLGRWPGLYYFFRSLDSVRVLEFDGTVPSILREILSGTGVFPRLEVIRVVVRCNHCGEALRLFAAVSRLRMEEGNPLAAIEPRSAEGDRVGGLGQPAP